MTHAKTEPSFPEDAVANDVKASLQEEGIMEVTSPYDAARGFPVLPDRAYAAIKWIVSIVMPAAITLLSGLGDHFSWAASSDIVFVVAAVTTFLGVITRVSGKAYDSRLSNTDGVA